MVAPALGNVLEFFDFALYGVMTPILAPLFFPAKTTQISVMLGLIVLLIGYISRPLGAIIFGHFGDRWGRKKGLVLSITTMACATGLMGALPTYAQAGLFAPIALIVCRCLQGISAGGEGYGGVIFALEHRPESQHGRLSSLMSAAAIVGLLLATFIATLVAAQDPSTQAWRIPFVLGALIGCVGLYMCLRLPETPMFLQECAKQALERQPLRSALQKARGAVLRSFGVSCFAGGLQLTLAGYITLYLVTERGLPFVRASTLSVMSLACYIPLLLAMGVVADRWCRVKLMRLSAVLTLVSAYPIYALLQSNHDGVLFLAQIWVALLSAMCIAPKSAILFHLFPTRIRYTGMSLGYTLGASLFGGALPLVNHTLVTLTGNLYMPAWVLALSAVIGGCALWRAESLIPK